MAELVLVPHPLGTASPEALAACLPATALARIAALTDFVAENAKTARAFLKALSALHPLRQPLQAIVITELNRHTPRERLADLLAPLAAGRDCGLISEAGMPAIADPGADLVRLAHDRGHRVQPLIGPSALLLALAGAGMNGQCFAFHGYLPVEGAQRDTAIRQLEAQSRTAAQTQMLIETPYRNVAMLRALVAACAPSTRVCAATDLSLPEETIRSMSVAAWRKQDDAVYEAVHKRPTVFLLLAG